MPSVCGSPFTFTSSTLYLTKSLHAASTSKQTNLTRAPVLLKSKEPFVYTKTNQSTGDTLIKTFIATRSEKSNAVSTSVMHGLQSERSKFVSTVSSPQSIDVPPKVPVAKPYVPSFTNHSSVKRIPKTKTLSKETIREKPLVPCFKKNVSVSKVNTSNLKMMKSSSCINTARDRSLLKLHKKRVGAGSMLHGVSHSTGQRIDSPVMGEGSDKSLVEQHELVEKVGLVANSSI